MKYHKKAFLSYQTLHDEKILQEHADKAGFPVTSIAKLEVVISPETAMARVD